MTVHQILLKLHNCFVYFDRNNLICTKQSFIFFSRLYSSKKKGALVQWLKLPVWKVGDRGFEPHSGLQVSKK